MIAAEYPGMAREDTAEVGETTGSTTDATTGDVATTGAMVEVMAMKGEVEMSVYACKLKISNCVTRSRNGD